MGYSRTPCRNLKRVLRDLLRPSDSNFPLAGVATNGGCDPPTVNRIATDKGQRPRWWTTWDSPKHSDLSFEPGNW
jgi:adenosyl cobinamide kinase/adenosyl cobinamide phosphate guanylyltransferase